MKYSCEITIDRPRTQVNELFDNPDNLKHWQPELVRFEHVSGTPGQPEAKSKLLYKMGKRTMEIIETVTVRNLPDEFSGTYEMKGVFNAIKNTFEDCGESTRMVSETEFKFRGFMKVLAFLMPGMFKKQTSKFLQQFKAYAESQP